MFMPAFCIFILPYVQHHIYFFYMQNQEIINRIKVLTEELNRHNYNYYVLDNPAISDYAFDILLKELEKLEQQYPEYIAEDSPTRRVGGHISIRFENAAHKYPMLSLGNTYSKEELDEFDSRIRRLTDESYVYVCEPKYDGVAIGLRYVKGKLVQALTRGDGVRGDDVTANVRTIRSIPLVVYGADLPEEFEARGEVLMPHKSFAELNRAKAENNEPLFANPRNAASGSLKLLDSSLVARRNLDCFVHGLLGDDLPFHSHYENILKAKEWGFKVSSLIRLCADIKEVMDFTEELALQRAALSYDIDGVVIKVNQYDVQSKLGFTSKFPRWAIAYKYKAEQGITIIDDVHYQVGRTGTVTPVAVLQPVLVAGTVIKRASLYNADKMYELDLHYKDTVFVEKGGEIIPKIVMVDFSKRHTTSPLIEFATHCPQCNTALERNEGEAAWYCPNTTYCPPQIQGKIEHFISRRAMNIDGLGEGRIEVLINNNLIRKASDLYSLQYDHLLGLEKIITDEETGKEKKISFREKTVNNILQAIENSREVPFERVLFALGIRFLGETGAKKIARHFKTIDNIRNSSFEELTAVPEIGDRIAGSIKEYFEDPENIATLEALRQAGLNLSIEEKETSGNAFQPLAGKSFVVSGVFEKYSRNQIKELIEELGGQNVSALSAKTSYLLAGDKMGPEKKKKAQQLNIPVISEADFEQMIG
jgi:DNA ligase (NAD+)